MSLWLELKSVVVSDTDLIGFGDVMFHFVYFVVAHEKNYQVPNWWMHKERQNFWFRRAWNVRQSIWNRIK